MSLQELSKATIKHLKTVFKEYYKRKFSLPPIPNPQQREYGFQYFDVQRMHRHIAFVDEDSLRAHLVEKTPLHAYVSTALYLRPDAQNMDEKEWLGANLVFDIDVDHIEGYSEQLRICKKCLEVMSEDICRNCGSPTEELVLPTTASIRLALEHLRRLLDMLERDLGAQKIAVYFSGHRGVHVHVYDEQFISLSSEQRREIVDYVKAIGIDVKELGFVKKTSISPSIAAPGWRARIVNYIASKCSEGELRRALLSTPPLWDVVYKRLGKDEVERLVQEAISDLKADVDEKVTIDTHRLIRLPGSINGKTGLLVKQMTEFEEPPRIDDVAPFEGKARVKLKVSLPPLEVLGEAIKGRRGDKISCSLGLALMLSCKGLAEIMEVDY